MFPASRFGNINVFAPAFDNSQNGKLSESNAGFKAKFAWSSPSTIIPGYFCCKIATASLTFCAAGSLEDPKLENESKAIRGFTLNCCTAHAVSTVISARSSGEGLTLTVVSAGKNTAPVIAGYATRLLADYKLIAGDELVKAFYYAMSSATAPGIAAAWLEGFLKGS